jgi:hypothetical protein
LRNEHQQRRICFGWLLRISMETLHSLPDKRPERHEMVIARPHLAADAITGNHLSHNANCRENSAMLKRNYVHGEFDWKMYDDDKMDGQFRQAAA